MQEWFKIRPDRFADLKEIEQPTLVANGNHDVMLPTINSYILSQHIPNAQLIIYPDSGHGSQFQYPELFLAHSRLFLDSRPSVITIGATGHRPAHRKEKRDGGR